MPYMSVITNPAALQRAGTWAAEQVRLTNAQAILVTGSSGTTVGAIASALSGVPLEILRKESEQAHSMHVGAYSPPGTRVLLLDDFVSTGATIRRLLGYATRLNVRWEVVAIACYDVDSWYAKAEPARREFPHLRLLEWDAYHNRPAATK